MSKDTLCWRCKWACGRCPWSKNFTPISGWIATETKIPSSQYGHIKSYQIEQCPLFRHDGLEHEETNKERAKKLGISLRTFQRRVKKERNNAIAMLRMYK